jgi:predicted nucleic-acid-binding Zn-ribbon protein
MKNTGKCPKCGGTEIIEVPGSGLEGMNGNCSWIQIGAFRSQVWLKRFVCGSCGFSEEWIDDKSDIEKLRNKYGSR